MKSSRRSFLEAGLGLPVLLGAAPSLAATSQAAETTASKDSSFDPWVEIHRENLRHNVQEISRRVASRPILAVIKNNGYGMGVANVARLLEPQPEIFGFAVVKLHEAISLRDSGIRKPILLLGPFDEKNLEHAVARSVMPMVYTPLGPELDNIAAKTQKPVPLHICVDTGIGRVGVPYYQAAPLVRDLAARKSVLIQGTMMTFTEDPDFDKEQLRRFNKTCASFEKEGISLGKKHAASSFSLFQHPDAFFDMVRPGMAIYGIYSENGFRRASVMDLYPAISLKARVIYAKKLRPGDSAGYNRAYVAKDDVWVADRLRLCQPLHRGNRQGGAHQNRRRCHFFRRPARLPPRGHFRSLRCLRLRPHHAPQPPPSAPLRVMDSFASGFRPSFSSFAPL